MTTLTTPVLSCRNVQVSVDGTPIVRGVDLDIFPGEKHALMGPNGSGKSTFAAALMGHPAYVVSGEIKVLGQDISAMPPDARARLGMFLGFQYPIAVPGLPVASFLRAVLEAQRGEPVAVRSFRKDLEAALTEMDLPREFMQRYLNEGFSGGEKKRLEIVQMRLIKPAFALLDEIDSGLDIDALKLVAKGIDQAAQNGSGVLMVTHYQRLLDHTRPDKVHVFMGGKIIRSGGLEVATELELNGYEHEHAQAAAAPALEA